jgi:D-alanine-D-alanine ligase
MAKIPVAVFFGGRSPEHDVSIETGLQVMEALRSDRYEVIPVYVATNGEWFLGDTLRDKSFYIPSFEARRRLTRCSLGVTQTGTNILIPERKGIFKSGTVNFDVAIPAFHGALGEDGCFQGLAEMHGVAYTGMRVLGSAVSMDKAATKAFISSTTTAPQLPFVAVKKGDDGQFELPDIPQSWCFPVIVKPAHMGSSIGVARADDLGQVRSIIKRIFLYDTKVVIEPFVAEKREYNIAVRMFEGRVQTSAIEMPKSDAELLDFKEKYGQPGKQAKLGATDASLLSLTRDINPVIPKVMEDNIRGWASEIFEVLGGTGIPRLDFIHDLKSDSVWFNEINPCPGSFGYFLWQYSSHQVPFSDLLEGLIHEAVALKGASELPAEPVPRDAQLFKRH